MRFADPGHEFLEQFAVPAKARLQIVDQTVREHVGLFEHHLVDIVVAVVT